MTFDVGRADVVHVGQASNPDLLCTRAIGWASAALLGLRRLAVCLDQHGVVNEAAKRCVFMLGVKHYSSLETTKRSPVGADV